jgi:hypothetical protein
MASGLVSIAALVGASTGAFAVEIHTDGFTGPFVGKYHPPKPIPHFYRWVQRNCANSVWLGLRWSSLRAFILLRNSCLVARRVTVSNERCE